MGMRSTSEAPVVGLSPIEPIVAALMAGPSPVRDFVVRKAGTFEHRIDDRILVGLIVVIGMPSEVVGERRSSFDRECVRRNMGRIQIKNPRDRGNPVVNGFSVGAIDEIEIERWQARVTNCFNRCDDI